MSGIVQGLSTVGWHLDAAQCYQPLSMSDRGWLWCETLQLRLGTWEGCMRRESPTGTCHWLRFYDRDGNLMLLPEEAAQQKVEQEQQRAERLAHRLRELREDPEMF